MAEDPYYEIVLDEQPGDTAVLRLSGDLDINSREELRSAALAAVATAKTLVYDFAATTFLDSEAMAAVIEGLNAARQAGIPVRVANAEGMIHRVLEVAGVLELFDA